MWRRSDASSLPPNLARTRQVQSTAGAGQEPFGDGPDRLALNLGSEAQQLDRGDLVEPLTHHDDVAGSLERASCRPWTRCLPAQPWCAPGPRAVSGRVIPVGPARGAVRHPGRHVVVESYSESHPRRPTTRAWRSSDEPTAPTSWPANVSAARRPPRTGRPHPPTSGAGGDCRCPLTPPAATSRTASRGVRLFAGHTGRVPGGLGWPVAGRGVTVQPIGLAIGPEVSCCHSSVPSHAPEGARRRLRGYGQLR